VQPFAKPTNSKLIKQHTHSFFQRIDPQVKHMVEPILVQFDSKSNLQVVLKNGMAICLELGNQFKVCDVLLSPFSKGLMTHFQLQNYKDDADALMEDNFLSKFDTLKPFSAYWNDLVFKGDSDSL
jgi:hypothetical protein